ncbi:hypothetical protein [Halosegnis sp.]|uniref:hypothetical protein n=1 Tax=Halosegnis sp. TaxID=2864959 RepID=UPI0035D4D913
MSRPPASDARVSGLSSGAVRLPGEAVLVRNDGSRPVQFRVIRRCDGRVERDNLGLLPGETRRLSVPRGAGPVTVEAHGPSTTASTAFRPDERPPLFAHRDGATLVVRD